MRYELVLIRCAQCLQASVAPLWRGSLLESVAPLLQADLFSKKSPLESAVPPIRNCHSVHLKLLGALVCKEPQLIPLVERAPAAARRLRLLWC
jgi:hypothetical protein